MVAVTTAPKRRTGRKRGNNEGSIYLRDDGLWCGALTLPNGQRKVVYAKTRRDVSAKMTAVLRTLQDGLPVPHGRRTVAQFLTRWLEEAAKPAVKPSTYAGYRNVVIRHLVPRVGKVTPTS
jgi:integrase